MAAYVVTVVGAGGKSTWIDREAACAAAEGKKTAVTTTTHIWNEENLADAGMLREGVIYAGTPAEAGKLAAPDRETWNRLYETCDIIYVEGDGSHGKPVKIPREDEPVIPPETDKIVILYGAQAVGRKLKTVCQRFELFHAEELPEAFRSTTGETIVTEPLLRALADVCYRKPLAQRFPRAEIRFQESRMEESGSERDVRKLMLVLLASGFGTRAGQNKLLYPYQGKTLYLHCLETVCRAAQQLDLTNTSASVLVVTQYEEIRQQVLALAADREHAAGTESLTGRTAAGSPPQLQEAGFWPQPGSFRLSAAANPSAAEGISSSIRIGTQAALDAGADAVVFFAADQPFLPAADAADFLVQFLFSGKRFGCMDPGGHWANPGAFRLKEDTAQELLALEGDRGAMRVIRKHPAAAYIYQIDEEKLKDIDTKTDLQELSEKRS